MSIVGSGTPWALPPRPYSDAVARSILHPVIDADTATWHYRVHQQGYVDALNKEQPFRAPEHAKGNANLEPVAEVRRRHAFNHAGLLLHQVYWQNMGGNGDPAAGPALAKAVGRRWGSLRNWALDFSFTAMSAKNSGWAVLALDLLGSGELENLIVDEHHIGALWGAVPIIACDVFEHAYYHRNGPDRLTYIREFLRHLNWSRSDHRFRVAREMLDAGRRIALPYGPPSLDRVH